MTRADLAAALEGATVEMLREDAAHHVEQARLLDLFAWPNEPHPNDVLAARHRRAAAALLALAEVEENGRDILFGSLGPHRNVEVDGDGVDCAGQGPTLFAALAALVRGTR